MNYEVIDGEDAVVVTIPHGSLRLTEDQLKAMVKAINDKKREGERREVARPFTCCDRCGASAGYHRTDCPTRQSRPHTGHGKL